MIQRGHAQLWGAILVLAALIVFSNDQHAADREIANQRIATLEHEVAALNDRVGALQDDQSATEEREQATQGRLGRLESVVASQDTKTAPQPQSNKPKPPQTFGDAVKAFFGDGIPIFQ